MSGKDLRPQIPVRLPPAFGKDLRPLSAFRQHSNSTPRRSASVRLLVEASPNFIRLRPTSSRLSPRSEERKGSWFDRGIVGGSKRYPRLPFHEEFRLAYGDEDAEDVRNIQTELFDLLGDTIFFHEDNDSSDVRLPSQVYIQFLFTHL